MAGTIIMQAIRTLLISTVDGMLEETNMGCVHAWL